MERTEIEFGDFRLKRIDSLNWQLFERREVKPRDKPARVDWVGLPAYFGSIVPALRYALDRATAKSGYRGDLTGAVEAFERIAVKMEKDVIKTLEIAV